MITFEIEIIASLQPVNGRRSAKRVQNNGFAAHSDVAVRMLPDD
jgi:hypothetical protein